MQNVNTDWLQLGREIFLYQSSDVYLYGLACLLEIPTENFSSDEDDWLYHISAEPQLLKNLPFRCLVMQKALNNALAQAKDASVIELISGKIEQLLNLTAEAKSALLSAMNSSSRPIALDKLFFHLSSNSEKVEHFTDDILDLSGDYFCSEICKDFAQFPNIKSLNLSACRLTDGDLVFLQSMSKLKSLDLSNNPISCVGLRNLNTNTLEELKLADTHFNASGTMHLRKLLTLRTLILPSDFDKESMESLGNSLVDCYISR